MARELTRKLIDTKGNLYCVSVPPDVNADSVSDIAIASHEGLVRLLGYKLDGEEDYKLPVDNSVISAGRKMFSFYKKLQVDISQEDFAEAMQHLIAKARESKINKVRVTEWEGKKIKQDKRGMYIDWSIPCHICAKEIPGSRRLSQSEGQITRAQMFQAIDKKVIRYRPGSKQHVCGDCAPKSLTPAEANLPYPTVEEAKATELLPEVLAPEVKAKPLPKVKDGLEELLELSRPTSNTDPMFLKGAIYGMLRIMKGQV